MSSHVWLLACASVPGPSRGRATWQPPGELLANLPYGVDGGLTGATSLPQYLHLVAPRGRSSDKQAGHVFTGAGGPNTVWPRRLDVYL